MTQWRWPEQECLHESVYLSVEFTAKGVSWTPLWCADCGYRFAENQQ